MRKLLYILLAVMVIAFAVWFAPQLLPRQADSPTGVANQPTTQAQAPSPSPPVPSSTPRPAEEETESSPTPASAPDSQQAVTGATPTPVSGSALAPSPTPKSDPFDLISQDSLFGYMEDLTAIQPYSGWRNSASEGEAEAQDYVTQTIGRHEYLRELGLEFERQDFHVFLGTELWDTRLHLTVDGKETEVPADGLRGPRDDVTQALRFDSDGILNDSARDPVVVEGPVVLVRSADEVNALKRKDVQGKVVFLDYAAIDRIVQGSTQRGVQVAWELLEKEPAGLVLVTTFSNQVGQSHGAFAGDLSALNWVGTAAAPPTLYVRLEDLGPAGIESWQDLEHIEAARLTWDADVFSPATSSNLIARIPGADPSRAMILGAHIDSPNSPGAMDDGSGSVVLMEVARVLEESQTAPPTDLYLVWFGSEELGLYGASHFVATHQELLDRTQAMLQTDMLSHPLDGIPASITLVTWSYGRLGDGRLLWPDYLAEASAGRGVQTVAEDLFTTYSDNSVFGAYNVPHADLIYVDEEAMEATGSLHYAAHIHDPYDTVELAREEGDVLEEMARVVLAAALDVPAGTADLRAPPDPEHRALFVASHTEPVHMTPTWFTDLGMALAMEGFDVDLIPYGQPVTGQDLADTDLVVALPVVDYPSLDTNLNLYDEAWTAEEVDALEGYVADGGLLVLTNSGHRLKYGARVEDANEDVMDANALASRFGLTYQGRALDGIRAKTEGQHPLVSGVATLSLLENNSLRFDPVDNVDGIVLARVGGEPAVVLVDYGDAGGQVLALADLGILASGWDGPDNLPFWQNLARYAAE